MEPAHDAAPQKASPAKPVKKRWIGLLLVVGIGWAIWLVAGEDTTVRRAAILRLGMPRSEVDAVMGPPRLTTESNSGHVVAGYGTRFEQTRNLYRNQLCKLLITHAGWTGLRSVKAVPVEVWFDDEQRVAYMTRGNETVGHRN